MLFLSAETSKASGPHHRLDGAPSAGNLAGARSTSGFTAEILVPDDIQVVAPANCQVRAGVEMMPGSRGANRAINALVFS